ncbi:hypothetical protein [Nocardia gipuzkoensis]
MRVHIVRPADLLVCDLEFEGITIEGSAPHRRLVQAGWRAQPIVIVHLPPQHVAEQAFLEEEPPFGSVFVRSLAAGPTRVAFRVPASRFPVDYRLDAILDLLTSCTLAVPPNAVREPRSEGLLGFLTGLLFYLNPPATAPPGRSTTAIELPLRLILSPDEHAGFAHAATPVTDGGTRAELWHSRLQPRPDASPGPDSDINRRLRAVWMRRGDGIAWYPNVPRWPVGSPVGDDEPFDINTMSQRDRHNIVHLSGNRRYAKQTGADFIAQPVEVRRLALSSLGAWLDSRGDWSPPLAFTSLIEWTHRATQGRDHFVRIVDLGFLYPFGHLAAKIKVTERKFVDRVHGSPPILLQREFIVVREPLRTYAPGAAPPGQAHTMPLRTVRFRTLIAPSLAGPIPGETVNCHVIRSFGSIAPYLFSLTGTDAEQNALDLATPLVWVNSTQAWDASTILRAEGLYAAAGHDLDARARPLALAAGPAGDTTYTTHRVVFSAPPQTPMPPPPTGPPQDHQPGFWPELIRAEIRAPALDLIAGLDATATISYHHSYRTHGFGGANRNEILAQLADPLALSFSDRGERAGGLIQPNLAIGGLSRRLGPVGGPATTLADVAAGTFDPTDYFAGATAKLFGVFTLDQVLRAITGANSLDIPRLAAEGDENALVARYVWNPVPQSYPAINPVFAVTDSTTMQVRATVDARTGTPRSDVEARIENFRVNLLGGDKRFLELHFDKIEFLSLAGRKPDVNVLIDRIVFTGPLSFVEQLRSIIPLDGFSDPPALEITPAGIRSSFSLALPSLAVGVFSLQNLGLGASFAIPFTTGALTVSFNFSTREQPFLLTVSLFGGGGFFGLAIDPNGVQILEAAIEFGASVAIDLGVAQGGVHVMAGIYFKIESAKGCTLTGYFRLGGNMSVLGLISASIELTLSFTYKDPGKAVGRAELEVEIDIFLFSFSVTVECEREFAGSASDPSFHELMARHPDPDQPGASVRPWNQYCEAYA